MIRTPECHASYLYLSYLRVPILPKVEGTPGTSGSKVPSYPWVPVVTTRGFLTSRVTTRWVLVRTSDFPEVPLPAGKNPCLSLRMAQLTLPTNRIWRRPYNPNADGNPNGDGHLLPQLGDVGAVLPVPMVNGVNDDPFLAPAPVGPLTQCLRDMDAGMANNNQTVRGIRELLRNIPAPPPPRARGRPRGHGRPLNPGVGAEEGIQAAPPPHRRGRGRGRPRGGGHSLNQDQHIGTNDAKVQHGYDFSIPAHE